MHNQFELLLENRFRPLFLTQFFGALNDNVFKTALITLVAFQSIRLSSISSNVMVTILPGIFILPFFLFSATAGQIADKFDKAWLIKQVKIFEVIIMGIACFGLYLQQLWLLVFVLFLMGLQSAMFGPLKYAYLPQHLNQQELVGGNGMIEMGTFAAILLGQILGAWLISHTAYGLITSIAVMSIALLGYFASCRIPLSPANDLKVDLHFNPFYATKHSIQALWAQPNLWRTTIAISWFWFYGATLLAQFPNVAAELLHGDESVFILLLLVFSLGVGIGSLLCEQLVKGKASLGLVMIGAIGLSVFGIDLYFTLQDLIGNNANSVAFLNILSATQYWRLLADIVCIGLFGGFYIVPLYVSLQTGTNTGFQSRIIAANNIMNALLMVISAGFSVLMFGFGGSIADLFLATAFLNALMAIYLCFKQPALLSSFLAWFKSS